jgi:hypothetical protein
VAHASDGRREQIAMVSPSALRRARDARAPGPAGVQVMDEQCCHEDVGGGRFEDLDAKPVRAGAGFLSAIRKGVPGRRPACQREGLVVRV